MRTYDDIQKELREVLTSPTWSNLKRGLLGQELISLAAYAIHSSDRGYSLFFRNFFPDTADKKGLLYLSGYNRVPIKSYKPAFIKIKMPLDGGMVYAPYSLVISTGALQYTNIGFIKGSSEGEETTAIFYQGKVRCLTDIESTSLVDFGYRNVTYLQKTGSNHTVVTNDPSDLRTQIILPKYAFPDSLKVYTTAIQIPVSEITGVTAYNTQSYAYYSLTELDETLRIVFGDGVTSMPLSLIDNIAVYYLELSFLKSNASLVELSYPAVSGIASKQISEADILSQFDGESYSLESSRTSLIAGIAKLKTISTKSQIIEFCRTSPEILDVVVSSADYKTNTITIKVKPVDQNDSSFEGLQSDLQLYGELVTQYKVSAASFITFIVAIKTGAAVPQSVKTTVEEKINSEFSYSKVMFNHPISEASITSLVKEYLEFVTFSVRLRISQSLKSGAITVPLDLTPIESSVKIYKGSDLYAWDRDGRILGFLGTEELSYGTSVAPTQLGAYDVGDFVLLKSVAVSSITQYKVYNPSTGSLTGISSLENLMMLRSFNTVALGISSEEITNQLVLSLGVYSLSGWRLTDIHNVTQSNLGLGKLIYKL